MLPTRRQLIVLLICGTLPVMTTASLAPVLPGLHQAYSHVPQIDVLSRLVLTTPALGIALGAGLAGYLLDHVGRRSVLAVSLFVFALFGSYGLWSDGIESLIAARFIFGFAVAGIMTATATILADHFEGHVLRSKMGLQAGLMGVWGILAQTASGCLTELSWRYPFALYLSALPLAPFVLLGMQDAARSGPIPKNEDHASPPIPYQVWLIGFYSFAAMGLFVIIPVQAPFYFRHELGIGPTSTSILVSVLTGASSLTSLSFAFLKMRWSQRTILALGFFSMLLGFLVLSFWTRRLALAAGMAAIGCGIGSIVPCISAWIAELITPTYRGRAMGLLTTLNYLGQFLTPLWSQPLIAEYGDMGVFLFAGGIALMCAMGVILSLRSLAQRSALDSTAISVHAVPHDAEKSERYRSS